MRNKTTAAILALFLGGIGIHRIYLGEVFLGLFYALFSWTFIPLIISFFDVMAFLAMNKDRFNAIYNYEKS